MATLYCSSRLQIFQPEMMTSSAPAFDVSSLRRFGSFPESKGLRIQHPLKSKLASLSSRNPRVCRQRGGIVCEAQETDLVPAVTGATWQSLVLQADGPVLVEFWAPWCGPCRMFHPIIGELAQQYAGKVKCFKLNTDDNMSIATQYGIRSIPTIMIFVKGEKKDTVIGAVPNTTLAASIEKFL